MNNQNDMRKRITASQVDCVLYGANMAPTSTVSCEVTRGCELILNLSSSF